MPLEHSSTLETQDLDDFSHLTAQESFTVEGQIKKMEMVEAMVRSRWEGHVRKVEQQLKQERGLSGAALNEALQEIQKIRIKRLKIRDVIIKNGDTEEVKEWFNLIVEKGDGNDDEIDPSLYRVMIPAHIDTVSSGARTELNQDLQHPDRVTGLGVYDMGAAALNNIALAAEVNVPKGMKVYFAFTVDEEVESRGARILSDKEHWHVWPHIDCVVSSEIGPLPPLPDEDPRMRLITARSGRIKFHGDIRIDPRAQGHGAVDNLPNAGDAMMEVLNKLKHRFHHGYQAPVPAESEPPQQRSHDLLGTESFELGPYAALSTREGYFPTNRANFSFAVKMVSPSTIAEYSRIFDRWTRGIRKAGRWDEFGISSTFGRDAGVASYESYAMPPDHKLVLMASAVLERISEVVPEIMGAPSVADECDYAQSMLREAGVSSFQDTGKGIITIPINGDDAHHPDEWVSKSSILQVRRAIQALIQDEDGFRSLLRKTV